VAGRCGPGTATPGGAAAALPGWASEIARLCGPGRFDAGRQPAQVTLRPAAVLVLLTGSPDGPAVLLTERAPDLAHYPGQLVFPGGAAEPGDDGPASTALREAAEETGLDPSSVQILGTLPALALPGSGFLLTPVLAWSGRPTFTGSANLAEVSALATVPLRRQAGPGPAEQLLGPWQGAAADSPRGALGAVTGVVINQVTGMLASAAEASASAAAADPGGVSA
jgi:8-oxo-dGTP pyrophosphatase MutT (NUDIX family)